MIWKIHACSIISIYDPIRPLAVICFDILIVFSWVFYLSKPYIALLRTSIIKRPLICVLGFDSICIFIPVFCNNHNLHSCFYISISYLRTVIQHFYSCCLMYADSFFHFFYRSRIILKNRNIHGVIFHHIECGFDFVVIACNYFLTIAFHSSYIYRSFDRISKEIFSAIVFDFFSCCNCR